MLSVTASSCPWQASQAARNKKNKISQPHRGLALRPQTGQEVANVNEKERNRLPNCEFRRGAEQSPIKVSGRTHFTLLRAHAL